MRSLKVFLSTIVVFLLAVNTAFADEAGFQPNFIEGGQTVKIGDLSEIDLDESLLLLDKSDTIEIQQYFGNLPTGNEIGSIFPESEAEDWFVLFEYEEVGHVSDKEKNKIDAKKLLKSYQEGTAAANEGRPEEEHLYVTGWHTEPFYNEADSTLEWALLAEDYQKNQIINYNVRILTRQGFVSVLLVTGLDTLDTDIATMKNLILPKYKIVEGSQYDDFDPKTDKKSDVGLAGLILGGAGLVAAKKAGLIGLILIFVKKFWFLVVAIPVALFGWIKRRMRNKKEEEQDNYTAYGSDQQPNNDSSSSPYTNNSSDQTFNNDSK